MKLQKTDFGSSYHGESKVGNHLHGLYTLHNVDVFNKIIVDDVELEAFYQTGGKYLYNDFDCPDPDLSLSLSESSEILLVLDDLYESDFENQELMQEIIEDIRDYIPSVDDVYKLKKLYYFYNDNRPTIDDFLP